MKANNASKRCFYESAIYSHDSGKAAGMLVCRLFRSICWLSIKHQHPVQIWICPIFCFVHSILKYVIPLWYEQLWETFQLNQTNTNILCGLRSDPVAAVFTSEPVASRMVGWAVSGAQAIHSTTCSCSRNSALHSFEVTTHTRTVWSLEQLAIKEPSWLGRTILTHSLWPVKVFTQYLYMDTM